MTKMKSEIITLPMTSNNSNGQVVSSSFNFSNLYRIYNEGGHDSTSRIISGSQKGHTTIQLTEPKVANKVVLRFSPTYYSNDFQIQGSNDGVNFDILATIENNTELELSLTFDNDKEYVYYRFYSTSAPNNFVDLYQINYYRVYTVYSDKILLLSKDEKYIAIKKNNNLIVPSDLKSNQTEKGIITSNLTNSSDAYKAFSEVESYSENTRGSRWIEFHSTIPSSLTNFKIKANMSNLNGEIRNLKLLGSTDGQSFDEIYSDTRSSSSRNINKSFYNIKFFKIYRIEFTTRNSGGTIPYLSFLNIELRGDFLYLLSTPENSEWDFINHGMSPQELSEIDFSSEFTEKHYINNSPMPLGEGKVFEQPLDIDKIIKKVTIK